MTFRGRHPTPFPSGGRSLELPDPFDRLVIAAVREMLARCPRGEDSAEAFLEWMREKGPEDHPGVFAGVPAQQLWPSFATNLGIGLWNAMPFPDNGFRPDPLPKQKAAAPCRCRSGKKHGRCCARLADPPSFSSAFFWAVLIEEADDEDLYAAASSLRVPGDLLLELAKHWQRHQLYEEMLKLLEPVFRQLPKILAGRPAPVRHQKPIRDVLEPLLNVFLDALMEVGSAARERRWRRRLLAELPVELKDAAGVLGV